MNKSLDVTDVEHDCVTSADRKLIIAGRWATSSVIMLVDVIFFSKFNIEIKAIMKPSRRNL